jgi:hypothetical protein
MWLIEQGEYSNLPPFSKLANLTIAFDTASWDSSRHFLAQMQGPLSSNPFDIRVLSYEVRFLLRRPFH